MYNFLIFIFNKYVDYIKMTIKKLCFYILGNKLN